MASIEMTVAFNQGCDARLLGRHKNKNPYGARYSNMFAQYWSLGWEHVERYWGTDVRNRWMTRKLPKPI